MNHDEMLKRVQEMIDSANKQVKELTQLYDYIKSNPEMCKYYLEMKQAGL